jgi:uncharacterized protein
MQVQIQDQKKRTQLVGSLAAFCGKIDSAAKIRYRNAYDMMQKEYFLPAEGDPITSFRCTNCGECCKGYGGIVVTSEQMKHIAEYLGLDPKYFFSVYCEILNGTISIKSAKDSYCLLYNKGCTVHPVKPTPCSRWPFFKNIVAIKDNWIIAKNNCPGILPESTYEDFLRDAEQLGIRVET